MKSCLKNSVIDYVDQQAWSDSTKKVATHNLLKIYGISTEPSVVEKTLINNGYSKYTIKQYFILASGFDKAFKTYFEMRKGLYKNAYKTKTKFIEEATILSILDNAGPFYNVVYLMARCGLRLSEALNLRYSNQVSPGLFEVIGKGEKQRLVPCNTSHLHSSPNSPDDRIAGNIEIPHLRKYLSSFGVSPHDLRAFFITSFARNKKLDLDEIQVVVGHTSLLSTQRYLRQNINEIQRKMLA